MTILSEVSQTKTNNICYFSYVESNFLKNDTNELLDKTETDLQMLKTNLWLPKGKRQTYGYQRGNVRATEGGTNQELGMNL